MDTLGASQLERLTRERNGPCVSVYLPTHPAGEDGQQDPVRLKNLLQRAESLLTGNWTRAADARKLLQPVRDLPADPGFWEMRSHGLAIFIAPDSFDCYRLPLRFEELLFVNRRFHVKPLLPLLEGGGDRFFILTLSQNGVRLFDASRYSIVQLDVEGLPGAMKDALNYVASDRGSQVHSAAHGSLGKQAAVFHGQGGEPDTRKDELVQFFRLIDARLKPLLREERAPLVLAGVEYLLPLYREINHYRHLSKQELAGNCDYLSAHELHQKALPVVEPAFREVRERAIERYRDLSGTVRASDDIEQIITAAREGRIDALLVERQSHLWGVIDSDTGVLDLHDSCQDGDEDLLDLAAVLTLSQRGGVFSVPPDEMPGGEPVAAVFRY